MVDFRIDTFLAVCKFMNYTQAAKALNLTQPAVTQHIQYLEKYYGQPLFLYEKKKLTLTDAGKLLLRVSTTMKSDEAVMMQQMHPIRSGQKELYLGATMTVGEYVLPKPLSRYIKNHPDTNVHLIISNTDELLKKLKNQEISLAIIEGYYEHQDFTDLSYSGERYIAVCGADYIKNFEGEGHLLKNIVGHRIILRETGSGTREILEHNLEAHGLTLEDFPNQVEVNSLRSIVELVKENVGISFMYEAAAREEIERGTICPIQLSDFSVEHNFTCLWNKGSAFEDSYQEICDELREMITVI